MTQSYQGLEFLKREEDCKLEAYLDEAGIPTIGYGSIRYINTEPVKLGDKITQAGADNMLGLECWGINSKLEQILTKPVNQNQLDALVSFCFNVGVQAFKTSTILRSINSNRAVVIDYFLRWDKFHRDGILLQSHGLRMRRVREYNLYAKE